MTSLLQPLDVSFMKVSFIFYLIIEKNINLNLINGNLIQAFKSRFAELWRSWYLNSDKSFTASGNMKSPPYSEVCNLLIKEIYKSKINSKNS